MEDEVPLGWRDIAADALREDFGGATEADSVEKALLILKANAKDFDITYVRRKKREHIPGQYVALLTDKGTEAEYQGYERVPYITNQTIVFPVCTEGNETVVGFQVWSGSDLLFEGPLTYPCVVSPFATFSLSVSIGIT